MSEIITKLEDDGFNVVENDKYQRILVESTVTAAEVYYDLVSLLTSGVIKIVVRIYSGGLDPSKTRSFDSGDANSVVNYVELCLTNE